MKDKTNSSNQELQDFLDKKSELSDLYSQSEQQKAPEHLEFTIKRMARDAVSKGNDSDKSEIKKPRWLLPLSLAATVLVAVSAVLVYQMKEKTVPQEQVANAEKEFNITIKKQRSEKTQVAREEEPGLSPGLQELIQPAGTRNENRIGRMAPAELLKRWTAQEWGNQVNRLKKQGKTELANRYIGEFPEYYPELDINDYIKKR